MICAVVRCEGNDQALSEMQEARRLGADLCELRADYLKDPDLEKILRAKPLPVLVTVRPAWEGGQYRGDESVRLGMLEDACLHGADWIDVEFRAYKDFDRREAKLVVSYHDFEKTPDDLEKTARKMAELSPALVKVACQARGIADLERMIALQKSFPSPIAVIAMGEFGEPLRILHAKYGGWLTFASIRAGAETAPGQLTLEELVRLYQAKTIDDQTEVYGVVGNPVAHSKSPVLFNDIFKQLGMNARYVRLKVDDPGRLRGLASGMGVRGLSVTIPHKQAVLASLDEADEVARGVGAANTVSVREGRFLEPTPIFRRRSTSSRRRRSGSGRTASTGCGPWSSGPAASPARSPGASSARPRGSFSPTGPSSGGRRSPRSSGSSASGGTISLRRAPRSS
jgi:3-dehydroquinate dehydratase/shikimate dehydrogenase